MTVFSVTFLIACLPAVLHDARTQQVALQDFLPPTLILGLAALIARFYQTPPRGLIPEYFSSSSGLSDHFMSLSLLALLSLLCLWGERFGLADLLMSALLIFAQGGLLTALCLGGACSLLLLTHGIALLKVRISHGRKKLTPRTTRSHLTSSRYPLLPALWLMVSWQPVWTLWLSG